MKGKIRPVRVSGIRFGFDGQLCEGCYYKHRQRAKQAAKRIDSPSLPPEVMPPAIHREKPISKADEHRIALIDRYVRILSLWSRTADTCDLCGICSPQRFDASEFEIEGRICGGCREELREERARIRYSKLAKLTYRSPKSTPEPFVPRVYSVDSLNSRLGRLGAAS